MLAINGLTLDRWQDHLEARAAGMETENRLHQRSRPISNCGSSTAISDRTYDFRLPEGEGRCRIITKAKVRETSPRS